MSDTQVLPFFRALLSAHRCSSAKELSEKLDVDEETCNQFEDAQIDHDYIDAIAQDKSLDSSLETAWIFNESANPKLLAVGKLSRGLKIPVSALLLGYAWDRGLITFDKVIS
jgi:hypothetical protein